MADDSDDVIWLDDAASPDGAEEELSTGRTRAPRWVAGVAVVAAAGVLIAVALRSAPRPSPSSARTTETIILAPTPQAARPFATPGPFEQLAELLHAPSLSDNLRENSPAGACAIVHPGRSPERAALRLLRSMVGPVRLDATSRTIDQFAGLCSLALRTDGPGRVRLALVVVSPGRTPPMSHGHRSTLDQVDVGTTGAGDTVISYARELTHDGWQVLVGVTGHDALDVSSRQLTEIVGSPALRW